MSVKHLVVPDSKEVKTLDENVLKKQEPLKELPVDEAGTIQATNK